ncbi:MAG TPA: hypothetical protein VMV18_14310 [bacterium]|nr:hypothetical protein [bacterium]
MRARSFALLAVAFVAVAVAAACGGNGGGGGSTPTPTATTPPTSVTPCPRAPAAADRDRFAVVAHPYDAAGGQANAWEVLKLSSAGTLSRTGTTFTLGRATFGEVAFTPDGKVGLVAQEDGSVGVFTLDAAGAVTVVTSALTGAFYAGAITMVPDGSRAIVVDGDTVPNGGGFYTIDIDCAGNVAAESSFTAARLPAAVEFLGDGAHAVAAAQSLLAMPATDDAALLGWDGTSAPSLIASANPFADDQQIVSAMAITSGGEFALIADDNQFSGNPNRIAAVRIGAATLTTAQMLSPFTDPAALVASPFDQTALVALAQGNALHRLAYNGATWSDSAVSVAGGAPQLPTVLTEIRRGTLAGHVLVAENVGVRQVHFSPGQTITNDGLMTLGSGLTAITGALGVQP